MWQHHFTAFHIFYASVQEFKEKLFFPHPGKFMFKSPRRKGIVWANMSSSRSMLNEQACVTSVHVPARSHIQQSIENNMFLRWCFVSSLNRSDPSDILQVSLPKTPWLAQLATLGHLGHLAKHRTVDCTWGRSLASGRSWRKTAHPLPLRWSPASKLWEEKSTTSNLFWSKRQNQFVLNDSTLQILKKL